MASRGATPSPSGTPQPGGSFRICVSGINLEWHPEKGVCTFQGMPVAIMWVDTTLAGLISGFQAMVGTERFLLALQSEGRKSVEADWQVISQFPDFRDGFKAIATIAAVAGWGEWTLVSLDAGARECLFRIRNNWEGLCQKNLKSQWGSGLLAGKMAGYCTKLFATNCWADQTAFTAKGDPYDEFRVRPSSRSLEQEIENLLATDEATRADMAVALRKLEKEIAERVRVQDLMRESEERYRALVETTDTGYVILGPDGRVLDANPEYVRLTGRARLEEIRSRSVFEWTAPPEMEKNRAAVAQCLKEGHIRGLEINYLSPLGKLTPVEINAAAVGSGDALRILSLCRDITVRRKTIESLQNMQKLESMGVLAGGIAHDFNNLLGGIFGYLQLALETTVPDSKSAGYLSQSVAVFHRARNLTQQLLTFAKGGLPHKKTLLLPELIRRTAHFALSGSPVNLELHLPPDLRPVDADEHQIARAMENIFINANQAMPLGGTLTVTASNLPASTPLPSSMAPGPCVIIDFSDQGVGIPHDILPRIFDPFFTTKQQGSGLGLATAFSILRKHGGHIEAHSEPGRGTTITLYLPAALTDPEAISAVPALKREHAPATILLVDDEAVIRETARDMLQHEGHRVLCARDGAEAISLYRKSLSEGTPIHLVVIDLTIPGGIGGVEILESLRQIDPKVKALAASGYSENPVIAMPESYGFKGSIVKPYLMDDFRETVARLLD